MSFLLFDEKTQEVRLTPEAKNIEVIQVLRDKDTTEDKIYFHDVLKFIYHSYKKVHMFTNLSISERKTKTSEIYLNGRDYKKYDDDEDVKAVVMLYISLEYTQNEWTYEKLKDDIEDTKESINKIPMKKKKFFDDDVDVDIDINEEVEIEIDVPTVEEGKTITTKKAFKKNIKKTITKTVHVKIDDEVDNSKERMDALKQILTLEEMKEKFLAIIIKERKTKEHSQELTLLEQSFFKKENKK